jgi:WD40 repeat protein
MIYSGSADGTMKSLNTVTGDSSLVWTHPEGKGISTLSLNISSKRISSGSWDGTTFLHSTSDFALVGQLDLHRARVNTVLYAGMNSRDSEELDEDDYAAHGTLAIGSADGRISLVFPPM